MTVDTIQGIKIITKPHSIRFENTANGFTRVSMAITDNFIKLLTKRCSEAWSDFRPKDCTSFGADYFENYETDLGQESSCTFGKGYIEFRKPDPAKTRIYTFHKTKMQSLMYDILEAQHDKKEKH